MWRRIHHKPPEDDVWVIYTNSYLATAACESFEAARQWLQLEETESARKWDVLHENDYIVQLRRWSGGSSGGEINIVRMPVTTWK
jgi:hypothetical protein